jgi:subtilisin family serine protease
MVKKIITLLLSVLLFATSLALPQVIISFDEVGEKSNYLIPTNINMEAVSLETEDLRETYCEDILKEDLGFQTVSLTEKQAERLGLSNKVEEDFIVRAETTQNNDTYKAENYTWNIPFVKGAKTDTETLGSGKIKVGILDSGVSLNDELKDVQRIDLVPNTIYDPIGIYNDVTGHGTSVAGIITAEENKNGIIGIAPDVSVYSIRVLDHNNEAPISRIIAGIEWAIENDINVLNMSFGTPNYSSQFYDVIRRAYEKGIVLVASAGNTGGKTERVTYPAKFSEVISVGACNQSGVKSDFSPDSSDVDILAPGEYIECIGLMNGYCVENGTSLATPHVTAAAALILSADSTKNPEFVKQLLISTANVKGDGCGILDIKNALLAPGIPTDNLYVGFKVLESNSTEAFSIC